MRTRLYIPLAVVATIAVVATPAAAETVERVAVEGPEPYRGWAQQYADESFVPMPRTHLTVTLTTPDDPLGGSMYTGSTPNGDGTSRTNLYIGIGNQGPPRGPAFMGRGFRRAAFYHELGHTVWDSHMPAWAKQRFQIIMGDPRPWQQGWDVQFEGARPVLAGDVPPEEHFADVFALTARVDQVKQTLVRGGYDTRVTPEQFRRVRRLILQTAL